MKNSKPKLFFCIGAQKAGTTWLYHRLKEHPNVHLPIMKELHYFDEIDQAIPTFPLIRPFFLNGLNKRWLRQVCKRFKGMLSGPERRESMWALRYLMMKRGLGDSSLSRYQSMLDFPDAILSGDMTPAYSTLDKPTIERIHAFFPDAKIIFVLRNLIERDWSFVKMQIYKSANKPEEDVTESQFMELINKENKRNDYIKTLDLWGQYYPPEQFLVCFYDELLESSKNYLLKILNFLELDPVLGSLQLEQRSNTGVQKEIPDVFARYLYRKHHDQLLELAGRYEHSPYPKQWYEKGIPFFGDSV